MTREEALNRSGPTWDGHRPWLLIPCRRTSEGAPGAGQELIITQFETAKSLIPTLEEMFAAREITVDFLSAWGSFARLQAR